MRLALLGVLLAFGLLVSACGGSSATKDRRAAVNDYFDQVDKATKRGYHIHFSGIEHKNSREVRHLPLGEGGPDMGLFLRALARRKRDATVICESPLLEDDALKLRKALAKAGASDKYK